MDRSKLFFIIGIALLILQSTHGAELNSEATLSCNGKEFKCINVTHYHPCSLTERVGQESQYMINVEILPCAKEVRCNDDESVGCAIARTVPLTVDATTDKTELADRVPPKTVVVNEVVAETPAVKSIAVDTPIDAVPVEVRAIEVVTEGISVSSTEMAAEKVVEESVTASPDAPAVDSTKLDTAPAAKKRKIAKFSPQRLIKGFRAASWRPHLSFESQKDVVDSLRKRIFERRNKYETFVNMVLGKASPVKQLEPSAPVQNDYDECVGTISECDYDSSGIDECSDEDECEDEEEEDECEEVELQPGEAEAVWEEVEGGIEIVEECEEEEDECESECCDEDDCDDDYEWEDGVVEEGVSCNEESDCCSEDCECESDDEVCKKKRKQFAQRKKNKNKKKKTDSKKNTSSKQNGDNKSSNKNKEKKQKKKVRYPAVQKIRKSLGRSSNAINATTSPILRGGQGDKGHPIKDIASAIGNGVLNRVDDILSIKDNGLFNKKQGDEDTGCSIIEGWECPRLGKYPHPVDCQRYVKCSIKGKNTVYECEEDEAYDPDQRQCTTDWSSCDALEQCLYHRQLIEDPSDESGYFICIRNQKKLKESYTLYRRQCTEDRLFDPDYQLCIDECDYERIKAAKKRRQQIKKQKKCSKRKANKSGKTKKSQKKH